MRLLLAKAMLMLSLSMSISGCVSFGMDTTPVVLDCTLVIMRSFGCSVKPERQNDGTFFPVSPARLDQPRYHYPRKIGRRPMGGL